MPKSKKTEKEQFNINPDLEHPDLPARLPDEDDITYFQRALEFNDIDPSSGIPQEKQSEITETEPITFDKKSRKSFAKEINKINNKRKSRNESRKNLPGYD